MQKKMERRMNMQLKKSRINKYKERLDNVPVSGQTSLYVVQTGAGGLGRSVLLRTNTDRYLFNCTESVQKIASEVMCHLGPVDNIFFTYNSWHHTGGVLGFLMSNPAEKVLLHGPHNIEKLARNSRMFSDTEFGHAEIRWQGITKKRFEDSQLVVEYVEILKSLKTSASDPEEDSKEIVSSENTGNESAASTSSNRPGERQKVHTIEEDKKPLMAYIVQLKSLPRKVDPEKLLELKTKSGPWIRKLIDGESVTLPDGRIIQPDDVLLENPGQLGPILVLDCPNEEYLEPLISNAQILSLSSGKEGTGPVIIVHMAPVEIVEDQRYKEFMDRFGSETTHLMLNENSPGPYVYKSQAHVSVLNRLHPGIFPMPQGSVNYNTKPEQQTGQVIQAFYGLQYILRPVRQKGIVWDDLMYFDRDKQFDRVKESAADENCKLVRNSVTEEQLRKATFLVDLDVDTEIEKLSAELRAHGADKDCSDEYPEITFLGTGSAKPSLHRNASGILVQMRKDEYLIMDCGEGTLLQMYQMFGKEKTLDIISKLKGIFISHLHFDHHGGLFGIMDAYDEVFGENPSKKLPVFGPIPLTKWFYLYSRCVLHRDINVELFPSSAIFNAVKSGKENDLLTRAKSILDVTEFNIMPVAHTGNSFGLSFRHRDGWKLVYSGDTMPSQSLVRYGEKCDILIHEGSFGDDQADDAIFKKHSTTGQAIECGRRMKAKFTLLTHFSQKYTKIPEFTDDFTENVGFAFDFMQVRPSQLWQIPLLKPALELLFYSSLKNVLSTSKKVPDMARIKQNAASEKIIHDIMFSETLKKDKKVWNLKGADLKASLQSTEKKWNTAIQPEKTDKKEPNLKGADLKESLQRTEKTLNTAIQPKETDKKVKNLKGADLKASLQRTEKKWNTVIEPEKTDVQLKGSDSESKGSHIEKDGASKLSNTTSADSAKRKAQNEETSKKLRKIEAQFEVTTSNKSDSPNDSDKEMDIEFKTNAN